MSRRKIALGSFLTVLGLLIVAGAVAVLFRKPLLQTGSEYYLEQSGIDAELTIEKVGIHEVVLKDLSFSNGQFIKAEAAQVRISYTLTELLADVLPALDVHGLRLVQTLPGATEKDAPPSSSSADESQANSDSSPRDLQSLLGNWEPSDIRIQDGQYSLQTSQHRYSVEFDGKLQRLEPAQHDLTLSMRPVEDSPAILSGEFSFALSHLLPTSGEGLLTARIPELGLNGQLEFSGQQISRSPELEMRGNLLLQGGHWAAYFPELPDQDETQETKLSFNGTLHLPAPENSENTSFAPADLISQSQAQGTLELQVINMTLPQSTGRLTTTASGRYSLDKERISFFPQDAVKLEFIPDGTGEGTRDAQSPSVENGTAASLLSETSVLEMVQRRKKQPLLEVRHIMRVPAVYLASDLQLTGSHGAVLSASFHGQFEPGTQDFTAEGKNLRVTGLPLIALGPHEISGSFAVSGSPESYEGHSEIRFDMEGIDTATASAGRTDGHAVLNFEGKGTQSFDMRLGKAGQVSVRGLSLPAGLGIPEAKFELQEALFHYRSNKEQDSRLNIEGRLHAQPLDFRQFRSGEPPLTGQAEGFFLEFSTTLSGNEAGFITTASGEFSRVRLDDPGLSLEGLSFKVNHPSKGEDPPLLEVEQGLLQSTVSPALFAQLNLTGRLDQTDEELRFTMRGQNPANGADIFLEGTHNLEDGTGAATISLPSRRFVTGGLQPVGLFPLLDMLKNVQGDAAMNLNLSWNDHGLSGRGQLELTHLDFDFQDVAVDNLNSSFFLDSLTSLQTDRPQAFSIGTIELGGLEFENISGFLTLSEGATAAPILNLASAQGRFADGYLQIEEGRFDLANSRHSLRLKVQDISIEQLTDLLDIEGLQAEGRFTGELPVTVSGDTFEIPEGYLEATRKGRIAFHSKNVRSALASGGEAVMLMMDALENFHYDGLRIEIHKPKEGESRLGIKLNGKNPDVLDGHPFDLNINLSGNLGPILQAVAEGQRLSQNTLNEMLELVR